MKAEILTIGDEILIGQINNTNSVWIAQQLNFAGIQVKYITTVGDEEAAIRQAFQMAYQRADLTVITGGLGPTRDDITKKIYADFFNAPLREDPSVVKAIDEYFRSRGRQLTPLNRLQALVPENCLVIKNRNGTAPGMWMEKEGRIFISMPGVPYEMKGMMTEFILPKLKADHELPHIVHRTVLTQGIGESAIADLVSAWEDNLASKNIRLAYLPQPGMVKLRLSTFGRDRQNLEATINGEIEKLKTHIGKYIFGLENYGEEPLTLEKVISDLLRKSGKTVSLAESCTGGYVSSLFTAIPGASEIFKGAIVPYSNLSKQEILQVDPAIFDEVGAVSSQCVEQLAANVRKRFHSDYSISISGIAGPSGATPTKPVGTVWVAVASANKVHSQKFQFGDNRQRNIVTASHAAMNLLRRLILGEL
jgi:nicotinamide-nucleotide amidase